MDCDFNESILIFESFPDFHALYACFDFRRLAMWSSASSMFSIGAVHPVGKIALCNGSGAGGARGCGPYLPEARPPDERLRADLPVGEGEAELEPSLLAVVGRDVGDMPIRP